MTNTGDKPGEGNFLISGRLVPDGREGNVVYGRSLQRGEEDSGEGIVVGPGEEFAIRPGGLVISAREIDEYDNPVGVGG